MSPHDLPAHIVPHNPQPQPTHLLNHHPIPISLSLSLSTKMTLNNNKGKNRLKTLLTIPLGCSNCGGTQPISDVHIPKPRPRPKPTPTTTQPDSTSSSTTSTSDTKTSASICTTDCCSDEPVQSWSDENNNHNKREITTTTTAAAEEAESAACSGRIEESVAVVTETEDPYREFRRSMLQMIFEKEIFSPEDLQHLLRCFLRLNSAAHHDVILRAFFDVCSDVASTSPLPPPSSSAPAASKPRPEPEPDAGPDGGDANHHDHERV